LSIYVDLSTFPCVCVVLFTYHSTVESKAPSSRCASNFPSRLVSQSLSTIAKNTTCGHHHFCSGMEQEGMLGMGMDVKVHGIRNTR
jgi:hypothetical protein